MLIHNSLHIIILLIILLTFDVAFVFLIKQLCSWWYFCYVWHIAAWKTRSSCCTLRRQTFFQETYSMKKLAQISTKNVLFRALQWVSAHYPAIQPPICQFLAYSYGFVFSSNSCFFSHTQTVMMTLWHCQRNLPLQARGKGKSLKLIDWSSFCVNNPAIFTTVVVIIEMSKVTKTLLCCLFTQKHLIKKCRMETSSTRTNPSLIWSLMGAHSSVSHHPPCPLIFPPSVITSTEEWAYFKALTKTPTRLEENMFHTEEGDPGPKVYLRPKESVHIPLKYQSFRCDHTAALQVECWGCRGRRSRGVTIFHL